MNDPTDDDSGAHRRAARTGHAVALVLATSVGKLGGDAGVMVVVREGVACTAVHIHPGAQVAMGLGYWASTLAGELRELADSLERDLLDQHSPGN